MLERRSHLAAIIIQYGFWIQVMSLVLFYITLESVSEVIPGAMCATGSLQANSFGFPSLFVKIAATILCVLWLSLHHVDSRLEDYRLTPLKFRISFSGSSGAGGPGISVLLFHGSRSRDHQFLLRGCL